MIYLHMRWRIHVDKHLHQHPPPSPSPLNGPKFFNSYAAFFEIWHTEKDWEPSWRIGTTDRESNSALIVYLCNFFICSSPRTAEVITKIVPFDDDAENQMSTSALMLDISDLPCTILFEQTCYVIYMTFNVNNIKQYTCNCTQFTLPDAVKETYILTSQTFKSSPSVSL